MAVPGEDAAVVSAEGGGVTTKMIYSVVSKQPFSITLPSVASSLLRIRLPYTAAVRMACYSSLNNSTSASNEGGTGESSAVSPSSAIDFLTLCHSLKTTKRAGWVKRNVEGPESVADHMYRMGLMGLIATDLPGVDREKCIKMAIVHDLAEAIVGDITPHCGVPKEEKSRREQEAIKSMSNLLGGGARAKEICDLWMEYEGNSSLEAKVVKDFDKIEMILQAWEYEKGQGKNLEEFFQSTEGKFQTELGKAWASEIVSRRGKRD